MSAVWDETFEGAGTSPAPGDALTEVNCPVFTAAGGVSTARSFTATAYQGTRAARFHTAAEQAYLERTDTTTDTNRYYSLLVRPEVNALANLVLLYVGASIASRTFQLVQNTASVGADPAFKIQRQDAFILGANSGVFPLGQWSRIDLTFAGNTLLFEGYPGNPTAAAGTATGTLNAAGSYRQSGTVTPPATPLRYHSLGSPVSSTVDVLVDSFRADTAALPGPPPIVATPIVWDYAVRMGG